MSTVKYKKPSPYQVQMPPPPKEDTKYYEYLSDLQQSTSKSATNFGFAIFGIGRAGTIHLSNITRESRISLLYIVEDDTSKWEKLKNYWNLTNSQFLTSNDSDVVFKDKRIRAVVVCSPTHTHEDIVKKALQSNKAVFCEKPVAETIEQTKACYEMAKKNGQPLLSAFNRRFDPSFKSVKNRVNEGEIGQILTVKVCSRDSPLPTIAYLSSSGGIFHDCAVHDIDMILYILGEYPTKVSVLANATIPEIAAIDDFDTVAIIMSFDSGAIGMIDLSRLSTYGYDQRVEVFGQRGMIKAENQQPMHNIECYTDKDVKKSPIWYSFPSRHVEGYANELAHFLDVLEGRADVCINVKDTLAVSRIASACEEAARTGKVVNLKWTKEELPSVIV